MNTDQAAQFVEPIQILQRELADVKRALARLPPLGQVGYAEVTADQSGVTTIADLTGLSVTWAAVAGRRYKITGCVQALTSVAGDMARVLIATSGNTQVRPAQQILTVGGTFETLTVIAPVAPSAGSVTYKLRGVRQSGTGSLTFAASATVPAFILVEDIGSA